MTLSSTFPGFGDPLPIAASPQILAYLARRRSASAMTLTAPGPSAEQLAQLLTIAARVPDHGKLNPWRFVVLEGDAKADFVQRLERIAQQRPDAVKASAKLGKLRVPPLSVVVVSRHVPGEIPEWEQRLSAGAVCTLMIIAAQAMGFGANWITDWYSYDGDVQALLALCPDEQIAGFIHIGAPGDPPLERVRPDVATLTRRWSPAAGPG